MFNLTKRKGFTLIELVVCVVILSVLASVLVGFLSGTAPGGDFTKIRLYQPDGGSSTIYVKTYTVEGQCIKYVDAYDNPGQYCGNYEFKYGWW